MTQIVFSRPNLGDLITRVTQQVQANLPGLTPQLRRSVTQILSIVLAQECYQLYAYIDFMVNMFFTASAQGIYLDRQGGPLGVVRLPGGAASAPVTFTGTNGYSVPAGAVLQTQDQSQSYTLNATVTIASGTATGAVTCTQVGSAGTLPAGAILTLAVAVAGINANVTVGSGGTPGVDIETDSAYKARILQRKQQTPQSGAGNDYVAWAELVAGVTRVFVYPLGVGGATPGTVAVAPLYDGRVNPIPGSGDLTNVANAINPIKPVTATVNVFALTADAINFTITGLTVQPGFTLSQVQANITASLQSLFAATTAGGATFGTGITWGSVGGNLALNVIYNAIDQSAGVATFDLASPSADIASSAGHIAVLGSITW